MGGRFYLNESSPGRENAREFITDFAGRSSTVWKYLSDFEAEPERCPGKRSPL